MSRPGPVVVAGASVFLGGHMSAVPRPYRDPIRREGARIDEWARRKYGVSGATLLAKLGKGEGNFAPGRSNPSSAGARGAYQFMPGTRDAVLKETGADAYGSPAEQTRAARIYLRRGGLLENYNPGGGQAYVDYILGQKVGHIGGGGRSGPSSVSRERLTTDGAPGQGGPLAGLLAPENPGAGVAGLLAAQSIENPPVPQTGPTLPAFNARRFLAMPEGYQAPASAPPAPKGPDLSQLIELSRGAGADVQPGTPLGGGHTIEPTPAAHDDPPEVGRLATFVARATKIDKAAQPYKWGGGHDRQGGSLARAFDCSGAVSRVLGINPKVASEFQSWGKPGRGSKVTIYANRGHVLMEVNGRFFGTSRANPEGGAGWIPRSALPKGYLAGFEKRHPAGL